MGIDYSTYVGPYAECHFSSKDAVDKYRCCLTKTCKLYHNKILHDYKFCNQCGAKIECAEVPVVVDDVDTEEIRMSFNEVLCTPMGDGLYFWQKKNKTHIWMPNRHLKCDEYPRIELKHRGSSIREIPIDFPRVQLNAFISQFDKELAVLCDKYGAENVKVKWGIVHQVH